MRKILKYSKRILAQKFTFMVIPHSSLRPLNFQFSLSSAFVLSLAWIGITSWAFFAVTGNIDYWTTKTNYEVLKLKTQFFAAEINKNRQILDQVKEADIQMRQLLKMGTKQSIIDPKNPQGGKGGPIGLERSLLEKTIQRRLWEISVPEILFQTKTVYKEAGNRLDSYKEISEHIAYERGRTRATPRGWPASGRITSKFGQRVSPTDGHLELHAGIDIANEIGTPVLATAEGVVEHARWEGGYGRLVVVDHGFGYKTYYGHNTSIIVKEGELVKRGQVIADMGSSGSSTGSHCHYEVWQNGNAINPWKFLFSKTRQAGIK